MRIIMPVDENKIDTKLCVSFGRTPYFMIYDTETKDSIFIKNTAAASQGGAGIKAAQIVADQKADALLTPRCGKNAAEVIKAAGIDMYKTVNDSVQDNIAAYEGGKLSLLDDIHAGFHGHGGK